MSAFLLGAARILLALQATQATVTGIVRAGESGEPLAGAVVVLPDLDRAVATDAQGRYVLRDVPAGPQHLTVTFIGYASRTLHALVPRAGQLEINVSLRPEPIRLDPVEVRQRVIVRGVERGDSATLHDRELSIAAIRNHPLLAEPDVLQALGGGMVVLSPEAPSGVHIRGGASDHTAYLLDGIPVFSPYHAAGIFSAWNPDAISGLHLSSSAPSPALPDALSGAIEAQTRTPGASFRAEGGVSTTQARMTVDGPLGAAGAGYLLSLRSGFPAVLAPHQEASYLRGLTGDLLAKIEAPLFGGHARLLGYASENAIEAVAVAEPDTASGDVSRNDFEWQSLSVGGEWRRAFARTSVRLLAWSAAVDADALWVAEQSGTSELNSARWDEGLLGAVQYDGDVARTVVGLRLQRSRTRYHVDRDSVDGSFSSMSTRTPVGALFVHHSRTIGRSTELELAASAAAAADEIHFSPRAQLRWDVAQPLTLSVSVARTHQFAQSLRNAESFVGTIFPVDLFVGAGEDGLPVARSDQGVIAADYRPFAGARVGLQAYERRFDGLLLVAPRDGEPFAGAGFATGSGASRGFSVDAAASSVRFGAIASYGMQRVRLEYGDSSYVPDHGDTHLLDAGIIFFPTSTFSVRLGVSGALGRRTTAPAGGLEWEACNLLDAGCEFAGSPHYDGAPLGATTLPPYLRFDAGVRKHWHFEIGRRDATIALFGTVTNLFARRNVLTYATDSTTGERVAIDMRPLAPLVVGLDWRF